MTGLLVQSLDTMSTASTGAQPYEGFVQSDDVRIHFRAAGQGPLLLLVHGFPDNGETYECQMSELSKNYTVVSPSLRGFPPSDVPENADAYDLAKVVGDLGAVIMLFEPTCKEERHLLEATISEQRRSSTWPSLNRISSQV